MRQPTNSELHTSKLRSNVSELQDDVTQIKGTIIVHESRFGNGREAMKAIREDIEMLKPKAPDWVKLMLAGLSVIGVLMGAQLWLTDRFNNRPTKGQVEAIVAPLRESRKETAREIKAIEISQSAQQTSIKDIQKTQKDLDNKLGTILDRIPKRRNAR